MYDAKNIKPLPADYDWRKFAIELATTDELDSSYLCFARAPITDDEKARALMGLVIYYHLGFAAWSATLASDDFWGGVRSQYATAPRTSRRRYFRGDMGLKALDAYEARWPMPEMFMEELLACPAEYFAIRQFGREIPQCGDYWIWKFADIYESLCGKRVDFSGAAKYSYHYPQTGAQLILPGASTDTVYGVVIEAMGDTLMPPFYKHKAGIQEAETVCCFMNKLRKGKYIMGESMAGDLGELLRYRSEINDKFADSMMGSTPFTRDYLMAILATKGTNIRYMTP